MPAKQVALDTALFLDSPQARGLPGRGEDVRRVAEAFLGACYDELGKAPRHLDGEDVNTLLGQLLPRRFAREDPLAERVPAVLEAYLEHLEETQVVAQAFEIRRALEPAAGKFLEVVKSGREALAAPKRDPFVHGAPKLGRNDPCSCGSGKKYKKCHGKKA